MANELIDTDAFIDHLRGARRLAECLGGTSYSVVTRCELFAGSQADEEGIRVLLSSFTELPIDRRIAERAGRVRRQTGTRLADALIAATALEHGLTLVTKNVRHFERVPDVALRLPN